MYNLKHRIQMQQQSELIEKKNEPMTNKKVEKNTQI